MYSKARVDKDPARAPLPALRPAPLAVSVVPITPSKHATKSISDKEAFTTPSRRSSGGSSSKNIVADQPEYAFAPSPSRLRALAASRSFSGSPNHRPSVLTSTSLMSKGVVPFNLGKSFLADTPRTKAKKWLEGDNVSPPVKLSKGNFAKGIEVQDNTLQEVPEHGGRKKQPQKRINAHPGAAGGSEGGFWELLDKARQSDNKEEVSMELDAHESLDGHAEWMREKRIQVTVEDEDIIGPSPVKPLVNGKGKGKATKRQLVDLFIGEQGSHGAEQEDRQAPSTRRHLPSHTSKSSEMVASKGGKFFSASIPPGTSGSKDLPVRITVRSKKRSSNAAALAPFDQLQEEDGQDETASKLLPEKRLHHMSERDRPGVNKKVGQEVKRARKKKESEEKLRDSSEQKADGMHNTIIAEKSGLSNADLDAAALEMALEAEDEAVLRAMAEEEGDGDESATQDDYDVRNLSDEYEGYVHSRSKPLKTFHPGNGEQHHQSTRASSNTLEANTELDPELVSLLSLRTSPVKNRLGRLHKKRDETVRAILQEPTFVMSKKKQEQRKGLEDLEDEGEYTAGAEIASGDNLKDDRASQDEKELFDSDDDWASEAEGWKDLGDGEMDSPDISARL